jgi:hypothetical protein
MPGRQLGVDFGTSNTVAMLRREDGMTPLLFDASPLLASAVFAGPGGTLLTGADAERAAAAHPGGYEPNPKRRIDDGTVWLGEREVDVDELIGAVLARVAAEARRVTGWSPATGAVLTHPATWGRGRLGVLERAARHAGLTEVSLVPEPVAAAAYFATGLGRELLPGRCVVVYDLGAGTFDVSVVRRAAGGFEVLATDGLPDVGGLDLDATVVAHARSLTADAAAWGRLDWPETAADQRARRTLWHGARAAKEQLSRHATALLHVPLVEQELHLTREEFERAARTHLDRTIALTLATLRTAAVAREQIDGLFLVGGSSRIPLVATLLQRGTGIPPTVIDQPELVVARGGLSVSPPHAARTAPAAASTATGPASAPPGTTPGTPPPAARGTSGPVPVPASGRDTALWQRPVVWIGAAALAAVLVLGSGAAVLWNSGGLPGAAPPGAAGVTFNATGKKNAKLFGSDDLLALAAPWLNDARCVEKPRRKAVEEVDCDATLDIWHIAFELRQSVGDRDFQRPTLDATEAEPSSFTHVTYTASHPRSGFAAWWCDKDRANCHIYWDDDNSVAVADLREVDPGNGGSDPALLCRIEWDGRVHPNKTVRTGS